MFLARDITRHDLRDLLRRGLRESKGRYKALLKLFAQPVKEILEELAGGDHLRQVADGRGDHADLHLRLGRVRIRRKRTLGLDKHGAEQRSIASASGNL